jgi:hemoglobin-like flavoprotein
VDNILSVENKALVRSTFEIILADSNTFTQVFYNRLFQLLPEARPLFHSNMDEQGPKLISMLVMLVRQLDQPETLVPGLQQLALRHVGYGVKREHYTAAGEALLWSLEKQTGSAFTAEVKSAWLGVYQFVTGVCIQAAYEHA